MTQSHRSQTHGGSVRSQRHHLCRRRSQLMQIHRQQFHGFIGPLERAVQHRLAPRHHAASLIQFDDDQQFRFPPVGPITSPLGFVLAPASLPPGQRADFRASAIDEHAQTLARPLVARGQDPRTILFQQATPVGQRCRPGILANPIDLLDVQVETPPGHLPRASAYEGNSATCRPTSRTNAGLLPS